MLKSYFRVAWRNLIREKGYSLINVGGLALGLTITILIGLWVHHELSFDKHQRNYNTFAAVLQNNTIDGVIETWSSQSYQLGPELRSHYGNYFKHVVMCSFPISSILAQDERLLTATGCYIEADGPSILSLRMLHGTHAGLSDPSSILLSSSVARNIFGDVNPVGKLLRLDNEIDVKVSGVYEDVPRNSSFNGDLGFLASLDVLVNRGGLNLGWGNNWLQVFVEVLPNVDIDRVSAAIRDVKFRNVSESDRRFGSALFLYPLSQWHLYLDFENGVPVGGRIDDVWLFSSIGVFVLLLACINFMNLSTARSQKRSKEVGVRKVVGSSRPQLIKQFFIESLLMVTLALVAAVAMVQIFLPWFNVIAEKNIMIDWMSRWTWLSFATIVAVISAISGGYPALYLSAFKPIKVLKGTFKAGRYASIPRKVLVVVQFTVSVTLIIATVVVYQQIEFGQSRPIGYKPDGLISIPIRTDEVKMSYNAFRNDLLASGAFTEVSASETTVTDMWYSDWGFEWRGKDPGVQDHIYRGAVDYDFGKTVGWNVKQGRDFSREFPSDSAAMILNEAAVEYMGFTDPIGETVSAYGKRYHVIGVVEDMVTQSLYSPTKQTVFVLDPYNRPGYINARINPGFRASEALMQLNTVFRKHNPNTPFEYGFVNDDFAEKFSSEAETAKLVAVFTAIAIFVSCMGLFGLASFVAEQRTKEIGIRKVLGASVAKLWHMLSRDFVILVLISCCIAIPLGYYLVNQWLQSYEYRTPLHWWVFLVTCVVAILITLVTVSFHAIRAALMNPATSLRSE